MFTFVRQLRFKKYPCFICICVILFFWCKKTILLTEIFVRTGVSQAFYVYVPVCSLFSTPVSTQVVAALLAECVAENLISPRSDFQKTYPGFLLLDALSFSFWFPFLIFSMWRFSALWFLARHIELTCFVLECLLSWPGLVELCYGVIFCALIPHQFSYIYCFKVFVRKLL